MVVDFKLQCSCHCENSGRLIVTIFCHGKGENEKGKQNFQMLIRSPIVLKQPEYCYPEQEENHLLYDLYFCGWSGYDCLTEYCHRLKPLDYWIRWRLRVTL